MHPNRRTRAQQQKRVRHHAANRDCCEFFNLLTGPQLLEPVESLLPAHRERLFPPAETLSIFLAQAWHWRGRLVRLVDGTTVPMPNTPANQTAYPQPRSQQPELGFPLCRMVGILAWEAGRCSMRPSASTGAKAVMNSPCSERCSIR